MERKPVPGRSRPALFIYVLFIFITALCSCSRDSADVTAPPPAASARQEDVELAPHGEPVTEDPAQAVASGAQVAPVVVAVRSAPAEPKLAEAEVQEDPFEAAMGRREAVHFLVKFEGGENAVAGHLVGLLLEEAYLKIGTDLGHYPDERIEALLYSKEAFRDITRSPSWAGAIYDGRIKLPAGGVTEHTAALEKVIFHEYTHAVVRELSMGKAPVWLNEGLAQYEEGHSAGEYSRVLSGLASKGALRLRPLEGSFMSMRPEEAQVAYILSLSATEYIIREYGLFAVRTILERIGEGMSTEEALEATVHTGYRELEKDWARSLGAR